MIKDPGNYRPASLTFIPRKVIEQLVLDVISRQLEKKKVIRSSQHVFTKGKPCSAKLAAFCNVITIWVDKGKSNGCCVP